MLFELSSSARFRRVRCLLSALRDILATFAIAQVYQRERLSSMHFAFSLFIVQCNFALFFFAFAHLKSLFSCCQSSKSRNRNHATLCHLNAKLSLDVDDILRRNEKWKSEKIAFIEWNLWRAAVKTYRPTLDTMTEEKYWKTWTKKNSRECNFHHLFALCVHCMCMIWFAGRLINVHLVTIHHSESMPNTTSIIFFPLSIHTHATWTKISTTNSHRVFVLFEWTIMFMRIFFLSI